MQIIILILLFITIVMLTAILTVILRKNKDAGNENYLTQLQNSLLDSMSRMKQEIDVSTARSVESMGNMLARSSAESSQLQQENIRILTNSVTAQLRQFEERLKTLEMTNQQKLEDMRLTISHQLTQIQNDNSRQLEHIRNTVDEKLQKTLDEKMSRSFQLVSKRLEEVYKGLGEMQNLAIGVGDLKKVLSNVKTRGILGEIQLDAILTEILAPEQYDREIPTIPGSSEHVEFAVKMPAADKGGHIYLPIDSKFPGDTYAALQDAYSSGDREAVKACRKQLQTVIRKCAKDICTKYIEPPYTTNFAIMFLPFEGLYAEVVNMGMVTELQHDFHVNIAGPSTMAAMLNSLQMGFRTLQIQKRSNEVWQVLGAVKTEFEKFETVLASAQNRIRQLDAELDKLVGVRTRTITKTLRDIEQLDDSQTEIILNRSLDE